MLLAVIRIGLRDGIWLLWSVWAMNTWNLRLWKWAQPDRTLIVGATDSRPPFHPPDKPWLQLQFSFQTNCYCRLDTFKKPSSIPKYWLPKGEILMHHSRINYLIGCNPQYARSAQDGSKDGKESHHMFTFGHLVIPGNQHQEGFLPLFWTSASRMGDRGSGRKEFVDV